METPSSSSPSSSSSSPTAAVPPVAPTVPSSPPDKYNVRWTTHHAETWSAFSSLLASGRFVDVTLSCKNRIFKAHRVVLSACSPYLRDLLGDSDPASGGLGGSGGTVPGGAHPIIILQDATPEAVEHVIEFMYTGNVDIPSRCLADFIKLAECFQVRGIKGDSETRPSSSSSPSSKHHMKPEHHGLPSPPSSTHDEDGDRSPKRRFSTASNDFHHQSLSHHQQPPFLPPTNPRKQYEAQMVNHYFRSIYHSHPLGTPNGHHPVPPVNGHVGPHEKHEDEAMVTIEKVYLQQNENKRRLEEDEDAGVDVEDGNEPCDFSMSKRKGEDGDEQEEEDYESNRPENYVIVENGASNGPPEGLEHPKKRRRFLDEDGHWQGHHQRQGLVPVEVTMGDEDEEAGDGHMMDDDNNNGNDGEEESGKLTPNSAMRGKNDRNPPALLPYQSETDRPFNIPADVSPESPLFRVSNSDTIWVGKTYNNWTMYFCSLCPYQSRIKSHLWRHSVKHTGQKPFVCALCLKAFSRRDNLKQHMNYKHPGYDLEPKRDTASSRIQAAGKTIIKGV